MSGNRYSIEVQPNIPVKLKRLQELARDLYYSWDREVRGIFRRLDGELWDHCGHNPLVFLRQVSQQKLEDAAADRIFMQDFYRVLTTYDTYKSEDGLDLDEYIDKDNDLVAYFCAEFGLHESFPIYSGGLGILAGDHCKAASDLVLPFVAVGLLYRQGYFTQSIDDQGNQIAHFRPKAFQDMPIELVKDGDGNNLTVTVTLPQQELKLNIWKAIVGRIVIYLLDSDIPSNGEEGRAITYQLYGGDTTTRIKQEIVLGIGGVRALRAIGLQPTAWHINEGHAAFQILERVRELVSSGMEFSAAWEAVAAGTVFTTHTPVPAGHDIFPHDLVKRYFGRYVGDLGITMDQFLALGQFPYGEGRFNQTSLALRGSRFRNGVSRIHGGVASQMEQYVWPQVPPEDNPIAYVTNGVHVPTFLSRDWANSFDLQFGGSWRGKLLDEAYWKIIDEIPDHSFWSLRLTLKSYLFETTRRRYQLQHLRNGSSATQIERHLNYLHPTDADVLTVGFARRFATYKRATLLFSDPERLARLLNDRKRPVIFIFAGKAHPRDEPGQALIRTIYEYSKRPEFIGRIIVLENYDLSLSRGLVTGVDVWLNTPEYPLEASGTSGQKAGINGVINLSITDGWWGEGYDRNNGWAITPHDDSVDPHHRDQEEANELLDLLEYQVIPCYYQRDRGGLPSRWVERSKASMRTIIPRFNTQRMVMDYLKTAYSKAILQSRKLANNQYEIARELAQWKKRVNACWPGLTIRRYDTPITAIKSGEKLEIVIAVKLNGLNPGDVRVEVLVGTENETGGCVHHQSRHLDQGEAAGEEQLYRTLLLPPLAGEQFYRIRIYPFHTAIGHRFEMGMMLWV
ncbi:MAG: alpha-glucan family phosphorylase [Gammaproteobacteria bacterium]|nr:alpha-glucan family phosphorylase [Gammaproteobacteria bacterium]